ncbi:MAG: ABC transporter permease [Opitutales bacterium]|nr:ABC transporter permease [Opitutales bacterium]
MNVLKDWYYAGILFVQTIRELRFLPLQWERCMRHSCNMGYQTLPIVGILSIFMGGILALQTGYSLNKIPGAQNFIGSIVGLSMCRELGPLMTAFLLTGRIGSSITAELASMSVYQEIDALKTMNLSPVRLLVMPRVVGGLFMMPFLTMFANVLGWLGGWLVVESVDVIHSTGNMYWRSLKKFVNMESIHGGLLKGELFALIIIFVSCSIGLQTKGGPREIGTSVTSTLVQTMIAILTCDYFVSKLLL